MGGVRNDLEGISDRPETLIIAPFVMPIDLVTDTVVLPWSMSFVLAHGEQDPNHHPEPEPESMLVGTIFQDEVSGYEVLSLRSFQDLPTELTPLAGARVTVLAAPPRSFTIAQSQETSTDGSFSLWGTRDIAWVRLRVEREGFESLEVPLSDLHLPSDRTAWSRSPQRNFFTVSDPFIIPLPYT
jgi:hypothetical protein